MIEECYLFYTLLDFLTSCFGILLVYLRENRQNFYLYLLLFLPGLVSGFSWPHSIRQNTISFSVIYKILCKIGIIYFSRILQHSSIKLSGLCVFLVEIFTLLLFLKLQDYSCLSFFLDSVLLSYTFLRMPFLSRF